jgi:hypothetical protein
MKILLLFSGQVRNVPIEMFRKSLIKFSEGHDVHIVAVAWQSTGVSYNHGVGTSYSQNELSSNVNIIIEQMFDQFKIVGKDIIDEASFIDYEGKYVNNEIDRLNSIYNFSHITKNSAKQLFMLNKSFDLAKPMLEDYDFIVRCRFDSIFTSRFMPKADNGFLYHMNFGKAFYPDRIYDIFFYTKPQDASKVFDIWNSIPNLIAMDWDNGLCRRDACRLLYLMATKNGLKIRTDDFRYCDVYRGLFSYLFGYLKWQTSRRNKIINWLIVSSRLLRFKWL